MIPRIGYADLCALRYNQPLNPLRRTMREVYDILIIGAGHAGCEAALAGARIGCKTLLLTLNMDYIALMPCNPSIGGPGKGHMVAELDALGGEMGIITDKTMVQIRVLNHTKGPAVQSLRAQSDKRLYSTQMKQTLESEKNLTVKFGLVTELLTTTCLKNTPNDPDFVITGVKTATGWEYQAKTVVITSGTSLDSKIIIGDLAYSGGRSGEMPAVGLSHSLTKHGINLRRWKTGTPPRIDARSVDYTKTTTQPGSEIPLYFSWLFKENADIAKHYAQFPQDITETHRKHVQEGWRPQLPCFGVTTTEKTEEIVLANLHRAPLYNGIIEGIGPRYCPSFEAKIDRFHGKKQHFFLEPEGWQTNELYVQGANTSLPEDVQIDFLQSIPGLEHCDMVRVGYAIEYDGVASGQMTPWLESHHISNLFFAGQVNGTSGYEEAAAQGFMAGVNAALRVQKKDPLQLHRDEAYIGVMIDDLINNDIYEPYRMLTSRAEYRLLLRQDTAYFRLSTFGNKLGLVSKERLLDIENLRDKVQESVRWSQTHKIKLPEEERSVTFEEYLRRPAVTWQILQTINPYFLQLPAHVAQLMEEEIKYAGYIEKQHQHVEKFRRLEEKALPDWLDYAQISGLRIEGQERLAKVRPTSLGQAARIYGVTPADIAILMVYLEKR